MSHSIEQCMLCYKIIKECSCVDDNKPRIDSVCYNCRQTYTSEMVDIAVNAYMTYYPNQRAGQAWMNVLYMFSPQDYNLVMQSGVDPFYRDEMLWAAKQLVFNPESQDLPT